MLCIQVPDGEPQQTARRTWAGAFTTPTACTRSFTDSWAGVMSSTATSGRHHSRPREPQGGASW